MGIINYPHFILSFTINCLSVNTNLSVISLSTRLTKTISDIGYTFVIS